MLQMNYFQGDTYIRINRLGLFVRHKTITLCLNSFEIASKKPNFSSWVRKKLLEEQKPVQIEKKMYGAYCIICDVTYQNSISFMMESHYCGACNQRCRFEGELV